MPNTLSRIPTVGCVADWPANSGWNCGIAVLWRLNHRFKGKKISNLTDRDVRRPVSKTLCGAGTEVHYRDKK